MHIENKFVPLKIRYRNTISLLNILTTVVVCYVIELIVIERQVHLDSFKVSHRFDIILLECNV